MTDEEITEILNTTPAPIFSHQSTGVEARNPGLKQGPNHISVTLTRPHVLTLAPAPSGGCAHCWVARTLRDDCEQPRYNGVDETIEAVPREGYKLFLRFEDGVAGEVDLSALAGRGVFASWRQLGMFEQGRIRGPGDRRSVDADDGLLDGRGENGGTWAVGDGEILELSFNPNEENLLPAFIGIVITKTARDFERISSGSAPMSWAPFPGAWT